MAAEKRLKVVIATRVYMPEVAAAAFRLKALADGLVAQGADVTVLTTTLPPASPVYAPAYKLRRWPVLRDEGGYVRGYVQYLSFDVPLFFRLLATTADVVVSEPPPTTGIAVALSSIIRRRPFVYYAADIWSEALTSMSVPSLVKKTLGAVEGFVLGRAAQIIAVSEPVAAQVMKFKVPEERITVAGNGVNTDIFALAGKSANADAPYFIYTGTMSEWQGASIFIRALALLRDEFPDVELRFLGQGTDEVNLKNATRELDLAGIHFGGVVPPAETAAWIRGAVGALVSIKPGQGYDFAKPTKIYAAAGCGAPVVFAGQGAGAEIVEQGGLGIAVEYTPRAVADAMKWLLCNHSDASTRQARADWVAQNASLAATGRMAAAAVVECTP